MAYEPPDYTDVGNSRRFGNEGVTLGIRRNPKPRHSRHCRRLPRLREAHSNDGRMLADGYAGKRCFQRKVRCHATELDDAGTVSTIGCGRTYLVRFLPAVEKKLAMVSRNSTVTGCASRSIGRRSARALIRSNMSAIYL